MIKKTAILIYLVGLAGIILYLKGHLEEDFGSREMELVQEDKSSGEIITGFYENYGVLLFPSDTVRETYYNIYTTKDKGGVWALRIKNFKPEKGLEKVTVFVDDTITLQYKDGETYYLDLKNTNLKNTDIQQAD